MDSLNNTIWTPEDDDLESGMTDAQPMMSGICEIAVAICDGSGNIEIYGKMCGTGIPGWS